MVASRIEYMIEQSPDRLSAAEVRAEFDALTALDAQRQGPIGLVDLEMLFWQADRAEPHEVGEQLARFDPDNVANEDEITRIIALDRLIGAAQAERLRVLDTFAGARIAADTADGRIRPQDVGRTTSLELSLATRVSSVTACRQVTLAHTAVQDYPRMLECLDGGDATLGGLRAVIAETQMLDEDARRTVDHLVAADVLARGLTTGQVRDAARRRAIEADTDAAEKRAAEARRIRSVALRPTSGTTCELAGINLSPEDALICHANLETAARQLRADGDQRTLPQLMHDLFVDRLGGTAVTDTGRSVELQVVISASTLLGQNDEPALLRGYGAIPSALALRLADSPHTWLRRLVADPHDGHLIATDPRTRRFTGELRKFIKLRDQRCAVETCNNRIAHIDHIVDYAAGGTTDVIDGQGLCENHNYAKTHPDLTVTPQPDGATRWRLPSGREYACHPPPTLGHGSGDPPF